MIEKKKKIKYYIYSIVSCDPGIPTTSKKQKNKKQKGEREGQNKKTYSRKAKKSGTMSRDLGSHFSGNRVMAFQRRLRKVR